jgi:RNA polymerase sigma factor (sigma-70 family)
MDRRRCQFDELATPLVEGALDAHVIRNDSLRALREALPVLTVRQQVVLRLTFEGKTQVEIADRIQAPLGSVKTWVRTGVIELQKLMNNQPKAACI